MFDSAARARTTSANFSFPKILADASRSDVVDIHGCGTLRREARSCYKLSGVSFNDLATFVVWAADANGWNPSADCRNWIAGKDSGSRSRMARSSRPPTTHETWSLN